MGAILSFLEPRLVWSIFEEISGVPRPSTKEEKIRAWVGEWAHRHRVPFREDGAGNILLEKRADPGCERFPVLVLQAHMDMVCQSAPGVRIDFERDPIRVRVAGNEVRASGTTLGADNGIGMAYALALLVDKDAPSGPLEALLTVNEETGFTGAYALKEGFFTGRYLLNLDSESLGEITVGSAGGGNTLFEIPVKRGTRDGFSGIGIGVGGLLSGHSGVQIHLPRLNAIKLLVEGIGAVGGGLLHSIEGGGARNAIPARASCTILVPSGSAARTLRALEDWKERAARAWRDREPGIDIRVGPSRALDGCSEEQSARVYRLLEEIPHGPLAYRTDIAGLVRTSNNLATVRSAEAAVEVCCLSRSSADDEHSELRKRFDDIGSRHGARVTHDERYPGWTEDPASPFLTLVKRCYETETGGPVRFTAVHAGLESGLFTARDPSLRVASVGPDIRDAHSTEESVTVTSVDALWRVVKKIARSMHELSDLS